MEPAWESGLMPMPGLRGGVMAHPAMPAVSFALAGVLGLHASATSAQNTTASLWSELGANSASNPAPANPASFGGISADPGGVLGAPAMAINSANGDIYVAWTASNDEIYVRRWNGSAWVQVGAGSASGGGISNSPLKPSESPRLAVRGSDGNVFVAWREVADENYSASDVYAAQFNGTQWLSLGNVSGNGADPNVRHALEPDIVLSGVFSNTLMPVVAWNALTSFQGGDAIYVKRWTGLSWVELGTGSASRYAWPGVFPDGRTVHARGINSDDAEVIRFYADGSSDAGNGYYHYDSCCVRLLLDPLGKPAAVFLNGKTRDGRVQYPYGLHVRNFIGDNSLPAYQAWAEMGRSFLGQSAGEEESVGRDLAITGLATGFSLHVAATVQDDDTGADSLQVLKFNGTGWSTLGTLDAGDNGSVPFFPSLARRSDGNLVLAWMRETDSGSNYDIHVLQTANVGGAFGWAELGGGSATGNGISSNPSLSGYPALALDWRNGNDLAMVAWQDGDTPGNSFPQTYVRRSQLPAPGLPALSIGNVAVVEGHSGARMATFTVGLDQPAGAGGVSFSVVTGNVQGAGNAAKPGSDYAASGPLPLNIPFGQTSASFGIKVFGDRVNEQDEVFNVRVIGLVGAIATVSTGVGQIVNDDPLPPRSDGGACDSLASAIADAERLVLAGGLSEPRGVRRILELETSRQRLHCRQ